jgi:hypothetical protein
VIPEHLCVFICLQAEGCRKHNFWTACLLSDTNYKFGILTSRAIDWYNTYGSIGEGGGWGGPPEGFQNWGGGVSSFVFSWATSTEF